MTLVRIQVRRDTAAAWVSANPVLAAGEPGVEVDTGRVKYGDGIRNWVTLPYSSGALLSSSVPPVAGTASAGTSVDAARADHSHALPSSISAQSLSVSGGASVGGSLTVTGSLVGGSHTQLASSITDLSEAIDDRVASLLVAGTGVSLAYNDAAGSLTISSSGTGSGGVSTVNGKSGNVNLVSGDIPDLAEAVQDTVAGTLKAGPNISIAYDDNTGEITITGAAGAGGGTTGVASVNGRTGIVVLTPADVSAAPASHTHVVAALTDFPGQATHSGKFLSTTGTLLQWQQAVSSVNGKSGEVTLVGADISDFDEAVEDAVAQILVGADGIRVTHKDADDEVEIGVDVGGQYGGASALPAAPAGLTATAGSGQASLSWTAPASALPIPVINYVIQYSTDGGATWLVYPTTQSAATAIAVVGLTNGTAYWFRVAAVSAIGQGAWSVEVGPITPSAAPAGPTAIALSQNTIISGNAANAVVGTLSATDATPGDTFTFSLVSGTGSDDNALFNISGASLRATSALSDGAYDIRIRVTDASSLTFEQTFTITATSTQGVPTEPRNLTWNRELQGGVDTWVLAWQAPVSDGGSAIKGYKVKRLTIDDRLEDVQTLAATAREFRLLATGDSGRYVGDTAELHVAAFNDIGEGPYAIQELTPTAAVIEITQQPEDADGSGGDAEFAIEAEASNGATLTYQWQYQNTSGQWVNL